MSTVVWLQKLQARNASLYYTHSEIHVLYGSEHKSPLGERKGNGEDGYYEEMTYRSAETIREHGPAVVSREETVEIATDFLQSL